MQNEMKSELRRSFPRVRRALMALGGVILASAAGCASGDGDDLTALQKAVDALGGEEALDGLRALSIEATGTSSVIDEGFEPGGPSVGMSEYQVAIDIDIHGDKMRLSYERESAIMIPGLKNTFSEIVAGDVGYILGNELIFGASPDYVGAPMSSSRWASVRKQQRLSNPHLLLRGLAERDVKDAGVEDVNGRPHHLLVLPDPRGIHDITLRIDAETGVIAGLSTTESDYLRGDVALSVSYDRWEPAGGLAVPRSVSITLEGQPVSVEERTSVQVDAEIPADRFAFPPGESGYFNEAEAHHGEQNGQHHQRFVAIGTAPFFDAPNTTIAATEIGQGSGIHHLTGAGHHSLLVDQGDSVILIEAPLHAARSEAILAWIDGHFEGGLAGNRISHVISTHHHADHSAGLRTFAALGATIVAAEPSQAFLADIFAAPRTVDPDALSEHPGMKPEIAAVARGGSFTLGNVTAHHIPSKHADDMLIVHVTGAGTEGIVFNSDLYNPDLVGISPGSIFVQGGKDLDDALVAFGLDGETTLLLGGHGNVDFATGGHFTVAYPGFKAQLDIAFGGAGQ
jgi:glyoxylase-like metal-dependent hydrolase (beta-lactamase superfamily II)